MSARIHQRYRIIDEVRRGRAPMEVADRVDCHFTVVYAWIRRFNESGFETFEAVPPRSAVVCFDQWGPLEVKPMGGLAWASRRRPHRMRATYHRPHGVEYFLGFYDVHTDCLAGVFVKRKRVVELCAAFERLRACYPRRRLYVVLDNLPNVGLGIASPGPPADH